MQEFLLEMKQIDVAIHHFLTDYGYLVYILLFLLIYCKTAFIVLTFLPGDATVFVSGALVALGELNGWVLLVLLFMATVLGDVQNYFLGRVGHKMTNRWWIISKEMMRSANEFFRKHGEKAILFSRFIPLMRTMIPFVTGYTGYSFRAFLTYNSFGGMLWVTLWLSAGLLLGQIPIVEQNMAISIPVISCIPFIPPAVWYFMRRRRKKKRIGGL
ncbi:MAG: VTT domain-containing protein [Lysinibacillus sp.]